MKKTYKFFVLTTLIFALIFAFKINRVKAVSTTLTASNATVNSEENFSVKITSSIKLSGWTISLTSDGGCTFVSASGVEVNGKSVYGTSNNGETSLATYTFKAPKVTKNTTYSITFSGTEMCDATDNIAEVNSTSCTATITVKAKEQPTQAPTSKPTQTPTPTKNTVEETPDFKTANRKVYTTGQVNLRDSWSTTSKATLVNKGTELTLTATSTKKVNGYVWYKVTYNGQTKYIASTLVSNTKPEEDNKSDNNNLSSLKIEGVEINPSFNKDITNYTAMVSSEVTNLDIKAITESNTADVKIEGNKDLKDGENTIKITVTAEEGTKKVYTIVVTKGEEAITTTENEKLKLSDLKIVGVNFDQGFDPNLLSYELTLSIPVNNLNITATANQKDAKVEIIGNEQFVAGENLVTIMLTSADETETVTYQIKVTVPEKASEAAVNDLLFYGICGGVIILAIVISIVIVVISRAKSGSTIKDDEEQIERKFESIDLDEDDDKISRDKRGRHSN